MRSFLLVACSLLILPLLLGAARTPALQDSAAQDGAKQDAPAEWAGEPYLLDTCAASGRPITVKGTPTTMVVEGRELKFCCEGCGKVVAKDPAKWLEKVDKALADQQRPLYPTRTCVVSDEPLFDADGEDIATEVIHKNRLFRTCCGGCARALAKDPGKYAAQLDELAMKAQLASYPLQACVVNPKAELTDESRSFLVAGRLVRTCCGRCEKKVRSEPYEYVMAVDAAWQKAHGEDVEDDGAAPGKKGDGGR